MPALLEHENLTPSPQAWEDGMRILDCRFSTPARG
jgi:hypothetical protein